MKFSFTLAAPVGNPRRNYAATIIQQNLREIGIDCRLRFDENLIFLRSQNEFRYDAALWGSDFARRPFNSSAFQNARLDTVIDDLSKPLSSEKELALWKTYQQILHEEQPRTFLYYYDELEGFSRRLSNVKVSLLSTLYNPYDWKLE
jgi:peptide/nickel transport system substrate-binding protein